MKKILTGIIGAILLTITAVSPGVSAAHSPGPLDNIQLSPLTASVPTGATQQFTAIARDSDNNLVPGVSFTWNVVAGGGTISNTGLFTAGNTTGNYTNTVQVIAVKGSVTKVAYATVKILEDDQKSLDRPHGWSQGKKTGWQNGDTPPGWSHGKKTGWNAKSTPPGLAKKNGIK